MYSYKQTAFSVNKYKLTGQCLKKEVLTNFAIMNFETATFSKNQNYYNTSSTCEIAMEITADKLFCFQIPSVLKLPNWSART